MLDCSKIILCKYIKAKKGKNLHLQLMEPPQLPLRWTFQKPRQAVVVEKLAARKEPILKPPDWTSIKMLDVA